MARTNGRAAPTLRRTALLLLALALASCERREASVASAAPPPRAPARPAARPAPTPPAAKPAEPQPPPAAPKAPPASTGLDGTNLDPTARKANILSTENGSHLVAYSDNQTRLLAPETFHAVSRLLYGQGYLGLRVKSAPASLTIELPQKYRVNRVGASVNPGGDLFLDKILVEGSTEGADSGFAKLGEWPLEKSTLPQEFPVTPTEVRWLRFTFPSVGPAGSPLLAKQEWAAQVAGLIARGSRAEDLSARSVNLTGTWKGLIPGTGWSHPGKACFEQKGASVTGIVGAEGGYATEVRGLVEAGVLVFRATRKNSKTYPTDAVAGLVVNAEADKLVGVVPTNPAQPLALAQSEVWWYFKETDRIQCKGFGSEAEAKSRIESDLEASGKTAVYGILFDFDKDTIKVAESKPVLDEVAAVMKKHAGWKFSVEGHTDNVGADAYNLDLSKRRAASVVKWLTGAGIGAARLSAAGAGESRPVATNETLAGRALNRRVEIVKK